jgi:hypothetical protein
MIDVVGGEKSSRVSVLFGYAVGLPAIHSYQSRFSGNSISADGRPYRKLKLKFIGDPEEEFECDLVLNSAVIRRN